MTLAPTLTISADVAIVGSGFSGAITAMALRRCGRSVVLLERGRHPRFAIGESSTPLANLLIEEIADRYELPRLRPFSKWGTWQAAYPDVACGLKRGFTFLHHRPGERFTDSAAHERQLLVAASPHDGIADTHWYRPDFDHWLVREAEGEGVEYLDEAALDEVTFAGEQVSLGGVRQGRTLRVHARFLIDASGPRGFLAKAFALPESPTAWLPPTQGL
jgi:FADH2 O2-dependent halogenase